MKNIIIIAEQVSAGALSAALPAEGVAAVTVGPEGLYSAIAGAESYRAFRTRRFTPAYRIDLVVEDDAVETVFEAISFAYGAGLFSNAEAWVDGQINRRALALSA